MLIVSLQQLEFLCSQQIWVAARTFPVAPLSRFWSGSLLWRRLLVPQEHLISMSKPSGAPNLTSLEHHLTTYPSWTSLPPQLGLSGTQSAEWCQPEARPTESGTLIDQCVFCSLLAWVFLLGIRDCWYWGILKRDDY